MMLSLWMLASPALASGQVTEVPTTAAQLASQAELPPQADAALPAPTDARERARQFVLQRASPGHELSPAQALRQARAEHAALALQTSAGSSRSSRATLATAFLQGSTSLSGAWTPLGPSALVSGTYGAITGRVTALALDTNDTTGNTLYVGTTGGGVWKSTNAAGPLSQVSFAPLTDTLPVFSANAGSSSLPSLSIGALAVQPLANPVVLAGTGDPNDATDSLYGEGLLRSTDGGLTWTLINGLRDGASGNHNFSGLGTAGLAWSTASPGNVVAAFSTSNEGLIVGAGDSYSVPGLYVSTDAGQTWKMATVYDGSQVVQQPQPTTYGVPATSVVWDPQRGRFFAALRGHGYYSSADGATWMRLAAQPGAGLTTTNCPTLTYSPRCPIFRGTLAVQPATGDLYALTVDAQNGDQGLWQDLCNAGSRGSCGNAAPVWGARLDGGALETGSGSTLIPQADYDLSLAAVPVPGGGTLLFAGTVDLYRCALGAGASSCTLRNTTNALNGCNAPAGVSPAQHTLAGVSLSLGGPLLYLGNDGGLWRSNDGVAETGPACAAADKNHFINLNGALGTGGSLAEITGFAQDPEAAGTLLAGLGAAGSGATSTAPSLAPWPQLSAGEGGLPFLDANAPTNWTLTVGAGVNLKQCTRGSACTATDFVPPATIGASQVGGDAALLDAPVLLDPAATASALLGTCRVWRGPAGSGLGWSSANALSPAFGGGGTPCTGSSPLIRSLAAGGPAAASGALGSTVIYAGMAGTLDGGHSLGGHVFVNRAANLASNATPWKDVALSPVTNAISAGGVFNPYGFDISSIAIDPHDSTGATAYATVMGFGGVPHLYQTADFGSHWLNISSNLPSAPANAVAVDPNDANTVYVAMDTGVYATQTVKNCSTTNCWSVLGSGLPNSPAVALGTATDLPTNDGRTGMLRVGTYGRGLWETPLLTASNRLRPALTLSAGSFTFATQQAGTQSGSQTLTITSSGSSPVTFGTLAISGDFVEDDTCAGQTVAVGSTCTVNLRFAPTATGARTGQLTVYANVPTGQATVTLNGSGSAPAAVLLTPLTLTFPATVVNATTTGQIITVSNTGGNPASLGTPVLTGDFAIDANTCSTTLPSQTGCSIRITFRPTVSGKSSGTLSITGSAGTQTAQLSGTGTSPATDTLAPTTLSFAQQTLGSASVAQQVTLTNAGDVALTLITATITAGDFTASNSCGNSLSPHSSCTVSITFVPSAVGTLAGTLTITDQFRLQTVALSGAGVAPAGVSLSPTALTFAATGVGLAAPAQTLTLTNNGGLPLNLQSATVVAAAGAAAGAVDLTLTANTCGASLAPGAACLLTVTFAPTAAGSRSAVLMLTDDAPGGSQTTSLTGTGIDFALMSDGATSVAVASGTSATFPLLLNSAAGLSGNVSFTCTGAPAHSRCTVFPATAALGASVNVTVTVQTGLATALLGEPPRFGRRAAPMLLALGLPVLLLAGARSRRRALRPFPLLLLLFLSASSLLVLNGCGAGRIIPLDGSGTGGSGGTGGGAAATPTPSGTYNLIVTGSSAGVTHAVPLTLIVQ